MEKRRFLNYWMSDNMLNSLTFLLMNIIILCILILNYYISSLVLCILVIFNLAIFTLSLGINIIKNGFYHRVHAFESSGKTIEVIDHIFPLKPKRNYREMKIVDVPGAYSKVLLNNEENQLLFYDYCKLIVKIIFPERCNEALVIGAGGCSIPKFLSNEYNNIQVNVVEICTNIIEVSNKYFINNYERDKIFFFNEDAKIFVTRKEANKKYQFIFNDLFIGNKPPEFVNTIEFLSNLKNIMAEDGVLVVNVGKPTTVSINECIQLYKQCFGKVSIFNSNGAIVFIVEKNYQTNRLEELMESSSHFAKELKKQWIMTY